jgi:hypothetical protein
MHMQKSYGILELLCNKGQELLRMCFGLLDVKIGKYYVKT